MNGTPYTGGNLLLDRLPADELRALEPHLEVVQIGAGDVLYPGAAQRELDFAIFPIDAVASMLTTVADGSTIEAGTAGREGLVGAPSAFGSTRMFERWIGQVPGTAARMRLAHLRRVVAQSPRLRELLLRYIQSYLAFIAQSVACNAHHPVIERCARWLLQTHDRVGKDEFFLTQEFLATMLGVRRPGVSVAEATLANAGFISYARGAMRIVDRTGLESASCECYALTRREFERLIGEVGAHGFEEEQRI